MLQSMYRYWYYISINHESTLILLINVQGSGYLPCTLIVLNKHINMYCCSQFLLPQHAHLRSKCYSHTLWFGNYTCSYDYPLANVFPWYKASTNHEESQFSHLFTSLGYLCNIFPPKAFKKSPIDQECKYIPDIYVCIYKLIIKWHWTSLILNIVSYTYTCFVEFNM